MVLMETTNNVEQASTTAEKVTTMSSNEVQSKTAGEMSASQEEVPAPQPEEAISEAAAQYANGKAAMEAKDWESALELYGKVIEELVQKHGELGKECAQGYYDYANALIRKSEESTDIFGDAVAEAEKGEQGEQDGGAEAGEDDADDLQIAWENLESARSIYEGSQDSHLELGRIYLRLGDVSMLNEQFEQAVSDFNKCLEIREEHCEPHDQRLVDVHTALWEAHGMASAGSDKDHATPYLHHLRKSLEGLELGLARAQLDLKAVQDGMADPQGRTEEQIKQEVTRINETIPDIKETITSAQESEQSTKALKEHINTAPAAEPTAEAPVVTTTGFGGFAMPSSAAASAPVTTLKARSKRKPSDVDSDRAAKAQKAEDKQAALMARMGGGGSSGFGFGGSSTSIGF